MSQWQLFCTSTGLKAFSFLIQSRSIYEKIFWAVTIAVCSCLTISDVITTSQYYWSEPTMTRMNVKTDKPFKIDGLTFCLVPKSNSQLLDNTNEVEKLLSDVSGIANLTTYIYDQIGLVSAMVVNSSINDVVSYKHVLDKSFINCVELVSLMINSIDSGQIHGDPIPNSTLLIYLFCQQRIGTIDTLIKLIGVANWALASLSVRLNPDYEEGLTTDHLSIDRQSWFSQSPMEKAPTDRIVILCTQLSPTVLNYSSRVSYLRVQIDSNAADTGMPYAVGIGTDSLVATDSENLITSSHNFHSMLNVKLNGEYKQMSNLCYKGNTSVANCRLECIRNRLTDVFSCNPLFSAFLPGRKSHQFCHPQSDLSHNITAIRHGKNAICREKCKNPCERRLFSFIKISDQPMVNQTRVDIYVEAFMYPQFEEVPTMSFRNYLSQLGGNLSLWLGASFLVLLHIFTFLIQMPNRRQFEEKKVKHENKSEEIQSCNCQMDKVVKIRDLLYDSDNRSELRLFVRQCLIAEGPPIRY